MTCRKNILIIGAGMSGLTAAHALQLGGHTVTIVEAKDVPGGWVQTSHVSSEGRIEKGPQLIAVQSGTPLHELLISLKIPLVNHRKLSRFIGIDGKLMRVPSSLLEFLKSPLLSIKSKFRLFLEPLIVLFSHKSHETNLQDAIQRRFGEEIALRLAPAIINGILAVPSSEVSQEALPSLRRSNNQSLLWQSVTRGSRTLVTPADGMGQLTRTLASRCSIIFNTEITSISYSSPFWCASGPNYNGNFDSVYIATSAAQASSLLTSISPRLSMILGDIEYTSLYLYHSTHPYNETLENSLGFLLHPNESDLLLGSFVSSSLENRDSTQNLKLRTFVKAREGPYPHWNDIYGELIKWLPNLRPCDTCHMEKATHAIPKIKMGQYAEILAALEDLPSGLDWIGGARFGPGVNDIVDGIDYWMRTIRLET